MTPHTSGTAQSAWTRFAAGVRFEMRILPVLQPDPTQFMFATGSRPSHDTRVARALQAQSH